jgi:hypothetical protein
LSGHFGWGRVVKRWWPFILVAVGMTLLLGGFAWNVMFAGIPYQDPPPALVARYAWHARFSATMSWLGVLALATGFIAAVVRRLLQSLRS